MNNDNLIISDNVIVNASIFKHKDIQKKTLIEYIVQILRSIEDELKNAHSGGLLNIKYYMPNP